MPVRVMIPATAAEIIADSPLSREHPDMWRRYLNHSVSMSRSTGHVNVTLDLPPNDLMIIVKYLEGVESDNRRSELAAKHACEVIYDKMKRHRGLPSSEEDC